MAVVMAVRLRGQLGEVTSGQLRRAAPPGELWAQRQLLGHLVDHVQDLVEAGPVCGLLAPAAAHELLREIQARCTGDIEEMYGAMHGEMYGEMYGEMSSCSCCAKAQSGGSSGRASMRVITPMTTWNVSTPA